MYRNFPKFSDRQVWANSADPDQTAPRGANSLGVRIFRKFTVYTFLKMFTGFTAYKTFSLTLSRIKVGQVRPNLMASSSGKICGHKATYMLTGGLVLDEFYVSFT